MLVDELLLFLGVILIGLSIFYAISVYRHERKNKQISIKRKKWRKELKKIPEKEDAILKTELLQDDSEKFKKFLAKSGPEIITSKEKLKKIYKNQNFLKEDIELIEKGKWWEKARAIERLKNLEIREAEEEISTLLYSEKLELRLSTLDYLSKINSSIIQNKIKNIFEKNSDKLDKFLLIRLFSVELPSKCLKSLVDSSQPRLRRASAILLGKENKKESIPLLKKLSEDTEFIVRIEVVRSIGRISLNDGLPILSKLKNDKNSKIRAEVAKAIGEIKDVDNLSLLEDLAQDKVRKVRLQAFLSLAKLGETGREIIGKYRSEYPKVSREAMLRSFTQEV